MDTLAASNSPRACVTLLMPASITSFDGISPSNVECQDDWPGQQSDLNDQAARAGGGSAVRRIGE